MSHLGVTNLQKIIVNVPPFLNIIIAFQDGWEMVARITPLKISLTVYLYIPLFSKQIHLNQTRDQLRETNQKVLL